MGIDFSVPGENPANSPSPLMNYLQPVETYRPIQTISECPLGNITKMINENENSSQFLVKTIYTDLCIMQNQLKFFKEIQNLSLSYFPTILPFAGFAISNPHNGRRPCAIFDNYTGPKLTEVLELEANKQAPENWDLTIKIRTSLGVALAVNYMHTYNYVHGNINAENVVFGNDMWPHLTDFTLNNFFDDATARKLDPPTKPQIWIAPELTPELTRSVKGDVYAFGMLMLHIFIGKQQFEAIQNAQDIIEKLKNSNRPKVPESVPNEIKRIIQQCWAQNPDDRPTMNNVIKMFEEYVGAIPNINLGLLEKFRTRIKEENDDIQKASVARTVAASGDQNAQNNFGVMLLHGKGVHKNVGAAARYFQMSADQGSIEGMHNIGYALENGAGVKKNLPLAVLYYRTAADRGSKNAQHSYACCLMKGHGVEKNVAEAQKYFRMAAQQNFAQAQYRLGLLHETGEGSKVNLNEALRCYKAASMQKYPPAMYRFGYLILTGKVTGQPDAEAHKNIMAAAQMGHSKACCMHGACCFSGDGVVKNPDFARKMFEKAVEKKDPAGYFGLAVIDVVNGKKESALENIKKGSDGGYIDAMKVWVLLTTDEEEKKKLKEKIEQDEKTKDSVVPLEIILKGTNIHPAIENIANSLK